MHETRPPEGGPNQQEAPAGTPEELEKQMGARMGGLRAQRQTIAFPQALVLEIMRCEKLLDEVDNTVNNKAALRTALNEARDTMGKLERVRKRTMRSFNNLKRFK